LETLRGRVAAITGAGRGLGREHALLFAREGAKVVVNDRGGSLDGTGADVSAAEEVVEEIRALGGEAVANTDNVASWIGAQNLIRTTLDAFGELHILVNNAGILRDRVIANMSEEEWDAVIAVHLKGHFCTTRFAAEYWRNRSKEGAALNGAIVNTSSASGMFGNAGQANYAAAKAGIAALTIVAARELGRYGVRVNAISPVARTRLTESTPGLAEQIQAPQDANAFDEWNPANISPLVAYLSTADCRITGQVLGIMGGRVLLYSGWQIAERFDNDGRWEIDALARALEDLPSEPPGFVAIDET
jgi:NAD(P)-dependent dehydrogenase (short-subunit alcohol dehydrogenase family)